MSILQGFYRQWLQETPDRFKKWISGYDMPSQELQDLQQRTHGVIYTQDLDLSVAQLPTAPLEVAVSGVAAVIYGVNTANVFDPGLNTGLDQVEPSAFVACRVNKDSKENFFPMKHNRGYIGSFEKLYLSWPAQTLTHARLVIFKYDARPWINGEHDNRFGTTVQGTKIVTAANVSIVANTVTQLFESVDTKRKVSEIYNNSTTVPVWVGDSAVTVGTGTPIWYGTATTPGGILYWKNTAKLYGIASANTTVSINTEY